jgi:predicted transposase/invertase (TIGR01784 family)
VTTSPHDALFRHTFSQPEHAASLLKDNLPAAVAARIDWSSLELQPGSFVSDELRWRHSDLIFRARMGDRDALLYFVVEHQSSEDLLMPWRMLSYVVRLCDSVLANDSKRTTLPAVIPIVVHHGKSPWKASQNLHDIIDLDDALKQELAPAPNALRARRPFHAE